MKQQDGTIDLFGVVDCFEEQRQNVISCSVGWKTSDANKCGTKE
jgi:hypothetical protein